MKHFYSCLLIINTLFGFAQTADSSVVEELILPIKKYPYLKVKAEYGALSNSLSAIELLDFVSQDYLDNDEKEELLSSIPSSLRFGYIRSMSAGYQEPGYDIFGAYKKGWGINVRNTYYNSARLSKDLLNLMFYGNKSYAGTTINIGDSKFETWYFSSIDYNFDVLLDTLLPLNLTVSIHSGHDHNFYGVKMASIYTEPQGAFLDMDLDYKTRDKEGASHPMAGLGLSVGAALEFPLNERSSFKFGISDFGIMYWNKGQVLNADSTFRFQGVYFSNIFDLNDSLRTYASDEYRSAFYYSDSKSYYRLMPFNISASYTYTPKKNKLFKEVFIGANYRYLAGYYPQLRGGGSIKTGHKQQLTTVLTVGGYTWAGLDVGYDFQIGRNWKVALAIHNINGLVIPVMSGGAFGTLAVQYRL